MNMTTTHTPGKGREQPADRDDEAGEMQQIHSSIHLFANLLPIVLSLQIAKKFFGFSVFLPYFVFISVTLDLFIYPIVSGVAPPSLRVILVGKKSTWPLVFLVLL